MRALLDTNVILDLLFDRAPFSIAARQLADLHDRQIFIAYVSAITPINVFYIVRKANGLDSARKAIEHVLNNFEICLIDSNILDRARNLPINDYEDAVQHAAAEAANIEAIVTRDMKDYANATLPIYSPSDFLAIVSPPE